MILGMGERGLTSRQWKFAELLASGSSKVDSFRASYPSTKRSKSTEWQGAKRVARLPQVRAEVERLSLQHSPHNQTAQAEHIAARLLELTKNSEPAIALRAIAQWGKLAEAGLLKPPTTAAKEGDVADRRIETAQIIDELRGLYAKALGAEGQQRNELVASIKARYIEGADGQNEPDAAPLNEPPPSSRMDEPLQSLAGHPTDQDEMGGPTPEVLIDTAPESLEPGDYELEAIPGRFPVRFRRVPRQAKSRE